MKPIVEISPNTPLLPETWPAMTKGHIFGTFIENAFAHSLDLQSVISLLGASNFTESICVKIPMLSNGQVIEPDLIYSAEDSLHDGISGFLNSDKFQRESQRISRFSRDSSKEIIELALNPFLQFSSDIKLIDGYFLINFAKRIHTENSSEIFFMRELLRSFSGNITILVPKPTKKILGEQSLPYSDWKTLILDVLRWFENELKKADTSVKQVTFDLHYPKIEREDGSSVKFPHPRLLIFKYKSINRQKHTWWVLIEEGADKYNDEFVGSAPIITQITKYDGESKLKVASELRIDNNIWLKELGMHPGSNVIRKLAL